MNDNLKDHRLEKVDGDGTASQEHVPVDVEKLPPEMRTIVSVISTFFRSSAGPDPETARILAETEMHEESCKLDGFRESLKVRDSQNQRDHAYRTQKMNHDTIKSIIVIVVCLGGIVCGLYLIVAKQNSTVGTPLLDHFTLRYRSRFFAIILFCLMLAGWHEHTAMIFGARC